MASSIAAPIETVDRRHSLNVGRFLIAGGITAAVVFVLCWIGTFVPFSSPSHAYINLFTSANVSSISALVEGTVWSLLFGALTVGLFALVYNAAAVVGRR